MQFSQWDTKTFVEIAHWQKSAMEPERVMVATLPKQSDQTLAFAKGIAANDMRALWKQAYVMQQFGNFMGGIGQPEDGQAKCGFRYE
ncbi:hypothetical protein AA100600_0343 [Gluconobacter thailandicus F149-1 = NBRC 100600]|nr:hypothetical protein AA100600_0343 [Gluconobacter thailandicus F149-1 = NBRC 100600]